ncbi:spore germination lipoprotein GerD [Tumebacillus flagellatus]|uniref:Spore germination GerD central core domain-containing protein n=1 Tax=Tumebacillus flagellatus TaxID=1157490 RepID=A0A074LMM5_9BACL|nr:spore germination lipoprotein GerD [Tumebacillus flagellatus]KEO81770.1 hypothetical protein EL26_19330 [Tumebacillus flagellatus]
MKRPWKVGSMAAIALAIAVSGCGSKGGSSSGGSQETASSSSEPRAQYNETKQMVLDILHTKEGLDTLKDIVRDPQFKHSLAINEADVSVAMQKALTEPGGHFTLMEQMKNPKFATALAQTFKKDNEQILKELMKDPEYQEMMLTLLKSPEYTQTLYDLMKTPQYRKQTMDIMTQSLQNPQFRLMYMDLMKQTIQSGVEEMTPTQKKQAGQSQAGTAQTESTGGGNDKKKEESGGEEKEKKKEGSDGEKKESSGDSKESDSGGEESGGGGKK